MHYLEKLNADWCHYIQFHLSPFILIPCDMTHQKQLSTESELSWHKKKILPVSCANIVGDLRIDRYFSVETKRHFYFKTFFFLSQIFVHICFHSRSYFQIFVRRCLHNLSHSNLCPRLFFYPLLCESLFTNTISCLFLRISSFHLRLLFLTIFSSSVYDILFKCFLLISLHTLFIQIYLV